MRTPNAAEPAKAVRDVLSDRSVVWNVEYADGNLDLTIGCLSQNAAVQLAKCLNNIAWIEADVRVAGDF